MYTTATIAAYDVLSMIHVQVTILQYDGLNSVEPERITTSIDVPGDGESRPTEWLRDVLVAVVETL